MKAFRLLLSVIMAFAMVSLAYAGTVWVNGQNMGTLGSMSVTAGGDVTITTSGGTPPPGGLSLNLSPSGLPDGTVDVPYNQSVTMIGSGGTGPYTYDCDSPQLTVTPSNAVCTISGTPITAGTYTVNFHVYDSAQGHVYTPLTFNVSSSTPPPGGGGYPKALPPPEQALDDSIGPYGELNYYVDLSYSVSSLTFIMSTRDWITNQDLMVSDVGYPTCSQIAGRASLPGKGGSPAPWYSITAVTDENVTLRKSFSAGQRIYVTVCNQDNSVGSYRLIWSMF